MMKTPEKNVLFRLFFAGEQNEMNLPTHIYVFVCKNKMTVNKL